MSSNAESYAEKKLIWVNIIFFAVTTLVGLIGTPLYILENGISGFLLLLTLFYIMATGMGITVGYHRLFAHVSYKAHPVIRFLLLFFGAAAFEQSALKWASQHRDHHRYVDTDRDPYDIKKGFFYAHIGWLIFWKHRFNFENVPDLTRDRMVMHQHRYFVGWAVVSGILVPMLIGAFFGQLWGALIIAVCLRLTFVYHSTFLINSVCHMFGNATYDPDASAKDHWLVALLTFGEGYHNFHHRFPGDYRNGVRWYHWDPSKWLIAFLSRMGLAGGLRRVSSFRIAEARLAGEQKRASQQLKLHVPPALLAQGMSLLNFRYRQILVLLKNWEEAQARMTMMSRSATAQVKRARRRFLEMKQSWQEILEGDPTRLHARLLLLPV